MPYYILLGVIQGLTEFLPVSSSGHLTVIQKLFGITEHGIETDIVLHLATLAAVCLFFRSYIAKAFFNRKLVLGACVATLITGIAGFLGAAFFENLFSSTVAVGIAWIGTGCILLATRRFQSSRQQPVRLSDAAAAGFAQSLAIVPGISRSGATISALIFRGVDRSEAFSFSFLISVPAILGAALFKWKSMRLWAFDESAALSVAFFAAFFTGLAALYLLKRAVVSKRFHYFGFYCLIAGIITLVLFR